MSTPTDPAAAKTSAADLPRANLRDWLVVSSSIVGAFVAVLDIQITNASLPNIEGAVGASSSEGSWISTAYLMAEIITIPLTGWFSVVFGLKRYLVFNTILFLVFSVACALSHSLTGLIIARAGQGFTGGVLIPTAITILRSRLPRHQQPNGIALFGVCLTLAPALGPTVGGWLTDNLSWHYIFYLNLLPGSVAALLFLTLLDPEPLRLEELPGGDWLGIVLMAVGLSSMTIVMEEGQQLEWFGSELVRILVIATVIGVGGFIWRELVVERPFIKLGLLRDRSLGGASLLITLFGAVSLGSTYIIPLYCSQILGYAPEQVGKVVMWAGLPQLVLYPLMPFIIRKVDVRILIGLGSLMFSASCFLNIHLSQDVGGQQLILPQVMRSLGQPLFTVPLMQLATAGLAPRDTADASALTAMMRNLGGSFCIAMISTVIERREHFHFAAISEGMTRNTLAIQSMMAGSGLAGAGDTPKITASMLATLVRRQATIMSYSDAFAIVAVALLLCLPTIAILRQPAKGSEIL